MKYLQEDLERSNSRAIPRGPQILSPNCEKQPLLYIDCNGLDADSTPAVNLLEQHNEPLSTILCECVHYVQPCW